VGACDDWRLKAGVGQQHSATVQPCHDRLSTSRDELELHLVPQASLYDVHYIASCVVYHVAVSHAG